MPGYQILLGYEKAMLRDSDGKIRVKNPRFQLKYLQ